MKKLKLYLDDIRTPIDTDWIVVRNFDEFVNAITKFKLTSFDIISLDHDLGESAMTEFFLNTYHNNKINYDNIHEKTGMDCAKFLVEYSLDNKINLPDVNVHSANPVGSINISSYIDNYYLSYGSSKKTTKYIIPHTVTQ